jgi:hypothetical protein
VATHGVARSKPIVLAILDAGLLARAERALGTHHDVTAGIPDEIAHFADASPGVLLLLDPELLGSDLDRLARKLLTRFGPERIVLYCRVTPGAIKSMGDFMRGGVRNVLLADTDDSAEHIRSVIGGVPAQALAERFLSDLMPDLWMLPLALHHVIVDVVRCPQDYRNTKGICAAAEMPRRSCDRALVTSRIVSVRRLHQAARVLRAVALIRAQHLTLAAVADRVAASSSKRLAADIRQVLGLRSREIDSRVDQASLVGAALRYVRNQR